MTAESARFMTVFRTLALILFPLLTAACSGGGGGGGGGSAGAGAETGPTGPALNPSLSEFVTAYPNGQILVDLAKSESDFRMDSKRSGYAMKGGWDAEAENFVAVAGLIGPERMGTAPSSGEVTYEGLFEVLYFDRLNEADTTATVRTAQGKMRLKSNFDSAEFYGYSLTKINDQAVFFVRGTHFLGEMDGMAVYRRGTDKVSGKMIGQIDATKAIGAFHANNKVDTAAGGFIVTKMD